MTRLLFATYNSHKKRELAQLLGSEFQIRDLRSLSNPPTIVESGSNFLENAVIKALAISRSFPQELVMADDSGLKVDALNGAPGVRSARYAGDDASDEENIEKLLCDLQSLFARRMTRPGKGGARSFLSPAHFRCVIAVAQAGEILTAVAGDVAGSVIAPARGTNGFGYDPVFVPQGFSLTFAELPAELKNRISHRARAAGKLAAFLKAARL